MGILLNHRQIQSPNPFKLTISSSYTQRSFPPVSDSKCAHPSSAPQHTCAPHIPALKPTSPINHTSNNDFNHHQPISHIHPGQSPPILNSVHKILALIHQNPHRHHQTPHSARPASKNWGQPEQSRSLFI